jgi:hypothetical protein
MNGELRYTKEGFELRHRHMVFRRRDVRSFGVETPCRASGFWLRHARQNWSCRDCGGKIHKGDMHASEIYSHYCLDCVVPEAYVRDSFLVTLVA